MVEGPQYMRLRGKNFRYFLCYGFLIVLIFGGMNSFVFSNQESLDDQFESTPQASSVFDEYISLTWNKTIHTQLIGGDLWGDEDYIYIISTKSHETVDFRYVFLSKWDKQGRLIWNREWTKNGNENGYGIWGDDTFLYTCGRSVSEWNITHNQTYSSILIKWDKQGNQIWNKTWNSRCEDSFHKIWGDKEGLYLIRTTSNSTWDETWDYWEVNRKLGQQTNVSLLKFDFDGNILWNNSWRGSRFFMRSPIGFGAMIPSGSDFDLWGDEEFVYFLENDELKLMKWDKSGNLIWNITSRIPKNFTDSEYYSICGDSNYLYSCGISQNGSIIVKFDKEGTLIWNRTLDWDNWLIDICVLDDNLYCSGMLMNDVSKLSIMKFDVNGNRLSNDSWSLLPGYFLNFGGVSIWNDGNDVYTLGGYWDSSWPSNIYLLKWDVSPSYFLYFGVPPIIVVAVGTVLWVWIKPVHRYKKKILSEKLQSVKAIHENSDYQTTIKNLEDILPVVEEMNDPELKKSWELMRKKCDIDIHFIEHLDEQKQIISKGELDKAYTNLVQLLKQANSEAYVGFIDKRIVSDITDLLKSVSERIT